MKLNTTSQYAIRIMEYIVKDSGKLHHAKEISEQLNIPYKYLTKIMTMLKNANHIQSIRGREGGYTIDKNPSDIKLIEILEAVNECIDSQNCILGTGLCNITKKCSLHDMWKNPKKAINDMFQNKTLADML